MNRIPALIILGAVLLAAGGIVSVSRMLQHPGPVEDARAELRQLRAEIDSCQAALDTSQAGLLAYNDQLDSLRGRVREMEALHPRGVPADSYAIYIETFRQYNDSVAGWEQQVETLQETRSDCVSFIAQHNMMLDSLRRLLAAQRR
jgi:chromosome segregation ATPase